MSTLQAVGALNKVFTCKITKNYTSSALFMKQLTTVAMSTITYLKRMFPESDYTEDMFSGRLIHILKIECEHDVAQFLSTALKNSFEAFEKKYLQRIALCFYEDSTEENLLEYYVFEYTYLPDGGASMSVHSGDAATRAAAATPREHADTLAAVRDQTDQLICNCFVMVNKRPLPEIYAVSLRLYYNDDAPEGYQAPGFSAPSGDRDCLTDTARDRLKLGSVSTPFHSLQAHLYVRGLNVPELAPPQTETLDEFTGVPAAVRCECKRDDRPPYTQMLVCQFCGIQQHAACYGVTAGASTAHCCVPCWRRDPDSRRTDSALANSAQRSSYAMFRRALAWLQHSRASSSHLLISVNDVTEALLLNTVSARKLMHIFRTYAIIYDDPPADAATRVGVAEDKLQAIVEQYFAERSDVGARLMAESMEHSQRSQDSRDLFNEVLSPLERVSLQATALTGSVAALSTQKSVHDEELNQYRAALADEVTEGVLPLPTESRKRGVAHASTGKIKKNGSKKRRTVKSRH